MPRPHRSITAVSDIPPQVRANPSRIKDVPADPPTMIRKLLDVLACPADKYHPLDLVEFVSSGDVVYDGVLLCRQCGRYYPVVDQVPIMLPDSLRSRRDDLAFLDRWKTRMPPNVLTSGKPWNQNS